MKWNCFGKRLFDDYEPVIESASSISEIGTIRWGYSNEYADENGFDTRFPVDKDYILKPGEKIIRYGSPNGKFTAVYGTSYDEISLPYKVESIEYHEYIVTKAFNVKVIVAKGIVAEDHGRKGQGTQYMHRQSISEEIAEGNLKEVKTWIVKTWLHSILVK